MRRFFGMMPANEITLQKVYVDDFGSKVTIQAGPNGWTVIYCDGSTDWEDSVNEDTVNFQNALNVATESVGQLKQQSDDIEGEQ